MQWFYQKWSDSHPAWITAAKTAVIHIYRSYERRHSDEALVANHLLNYYHLTKFERSNILRSHHLERDEL